MNTTSEITNVTRKLAVAAFEAVNVKNLFLNVGMNLDREAVMREQMLPPYEIRTDEEGMKYRNALVTRLYELKCGEEALLEDIQGFNELTRMVNTIMGQLKLSVDRMRETFVKFLPAESPYRNPELFVSVLQSEELLKKDESDPASRAAGYKLEFRI